jgi:hypothetical protein
LQCEARQFLPNFSFEMFEWLEIEGRKPGFMSRTLWRKKTSTHFFLWCQHTLWSNLFSNQKGGNEKHKTFCSAWFARSTYTWWMLCDDWLIGFFEPMLKLDFWQ